MRIRHSSRDSPHTHTHTRTHTHTTTWHTQEYGSYCLTQKHIRLPIESRIFVAFYTHLHSSLEAPTTQITAKQQNERTKIYEIPIENTLIKYEYGYSDSTIP